MQTLREAEALARQLGWRIERTASRHILFYPPDPRLGSVVVSGTPSDTRSWKNALSRLRAAGLVKEKRKMQGTMCQFCQKECFNLFALEEHEAGCQKRPKVTTDLRLKTTPGKLAPRKRGKRGNRG